MMRVYQIVKRLKKSLFSRDWMRDRMENCVRGIHFDPPIKTNQNVNVDYRHEVQTRQRVDVRFLWPIRLFPTHKWKERMRSLEE